MAHCRGRVYVNSYMEDGGGQTGDANKLATINEVKEIAAESGGGGKFIDNFDRGYTTIQGNQTAPIGFNTIALLDSDGLATKNFANISQVLMSWDQMNPEYITKTGHIKLTDEGSEILRGYLTVLDYKLSDGRNVAFQVMPGKYGGNTSEIGYGKRLSLTFNGVLFGTYDALEPWMNKPFNRWNEGDFFKEATGVTYVYQDGKWHCGWWALRNGVLPIIDKPKVRCTVSPVDWMDYPSSASPTEQPHFILKASSTNTRSQLRRTTMTWPRWLRQKLTASKSPSPTEFARDKDWNKSYGEFGSMNESNAYVSKWSEARQLYFLNVDSDGRQSPDA